MEILNLLQFLHGLIVKLMLFAKNLKHTKSLKYFTVPYHI